MMASFRSMDNDPVHFSGEQMPIKPERLNFHLPARRALDGCDHSMPEILFKPVRLQQTQNKNNTGAENACGSKYDSLSSRHEHHWSALSRNIILTCLRLSSSQAARIWSVRSSRRDSRTAS